MRHTPALLCGVLALLLAAGYGPIGCGDDEGNVVTVDLERLCADSLQAMNSQGCRNNAYANVDDLKGCVSACGPADQECLNACFNEPGSGFSSCEGDVDFLFAGQCGECFTACGFDFVGDESDPGCLFAPNPAVTGTDCLDALYACVNGC